MLRTKVSQALADEIGPDLFAHILRDQLRTTMGHFRDVLSGRAADEEAASTDRPEPIPGWLVTRLLYTVGVPEAEVRQMTADEARARWETYTRGEG